MRDPYEVLGIQRGATDDEIKKAYRAKCKRWHPDLNPNDPTAEEHFKEVQAAYDAITKGDTGPQMGGQPGGGYGYGQQGYYQGGYQQGYDQGYSQNGWQQGDFGFGFDEELSGKVKFNMLYLQVPVVVSWHFNVRSVSIQPLAGVFYGFGIHGKAKFKGEKADLFKSTDLGDGAEEEAMFKRSDLGLRFGVNVTFRKHYNVSLGYDLGLLNILKDADEVKAKNGSFFVSLGYNF